MLGQTARRVLQVMMLVPALTTASLALATGQSRAAGPAAAPPPAPAAASAQNSSQPERTTSVFGDWTVTCTSRPGLPNQCEAGFSVQDQQHQLAMVFAIGRVSKDQPLHAVVQVPVNIRTGTPLRLVIDAGDPVLVPFQQCNRLGCFADIELKDDSLIRRLRTRPVDTAGRVEWHDSGNNDVALPLSTRGFASAIDSLNTANSR